MNAAKPSLDSVQLNVIVSLIENAASDLRQRNHCASRHPASSMALHLNDSEQLHRTRPAKVFRSTQRSERSKIPVWAGLLGLDWPPPVSF